MNSSRRCAVSTLLMPLCCGIVGVAYGVGLPDAPAVPAAHSKSAAALDLRVPELRHVLSQRELLADMNSNFDEDAIEVVAAPPLVPMSFDFAVPPGIVDSLHWSIGHPTQAWRILLPATAGP
jgi:hypothetical protein